jgi:hypothetical protein
MTTILKEMNELKAMEEIILRKKYIACKDSGHSLEKFYLNESMAEDLANYLYLNGYRKVSE